MAMSSNVMRDTFKLPKLPGNSFQEEMARKSYRKRQMMQLETGPKPLDVDRIPVDFEAIKMSAENKAREATMAGTTPGSPTADDTQNTLDRKVLRFTGYFKEGVHESRVESERLRRCVVYYYLEDDTISVSEPREDNSGMPQGCLLKRHQVPRPDDGGFYTFEQLTVGENVFFYGKCFHLCDCDPFTRSFLTGIGVEVAEGETFPRDEYQTVRAKTMARRPRDAEDRHLVAVMEYNYSGKRTVLAPEELRATQQFLLNDRKVLKFGARWDDSAALYGDRRKFTLYYFLADDTIEVTEDLPVNAGRDPFPSFIRRRKVALPTGKRADNPKASLSFRNDPQEHYTDADLSVGATVDVFGRRFFLVSCDAATDKYLQETHGRPPAKTIHTDPPPKQHPKPVPPPYNGFGDEQDSLGSWKNLVLKPPKKNLKQYIENSSLMLKFSMRMYDTDPANEVRRFVLTYYLADDTASIFEPVQRNSGIIGGKFLQRMKVKRSDTGESLKAADLYIGAKIEINNHKFALFATDEKSLNHMEQRSESYDKSSINDVMAKLKAMLQSSHTNLAKAIREADRNGDQHIDYKELNDLFQSLNLDVSEHEILTVLRYLDENRDGSVTFAELLHRALPEGGENEIDLPWETIYGRSQHGD
eukprot:gene8062-12397_t